MENIVKIIKYFAVWIRNLHVEFPLCSSYRIRDMNISMLTLELKHYSNNRHYGHPSISITQLVCYVLHTSKLAL